jgi:hypothetical protein
MWLKLTFVVDPFDGDRLTLRLFAGIAKAVEQAIKGQWKAGIQNQHLKNHGMGESYAVID